MTDPVQTLSSENRIEIKASPEQIWDALTQGEQLTRWFATDAKDAKPGGNFFVSWKEHGPIDSPITVFEPGKHLQIASEMPGMPVPFATDFFIEAKGGVTLVRIVQSGFSVDAKWDDEFDAMTQGWGFFARNLRFYLERFAGQACVTIGFPVAQKANRDQAFDKFCKTLGLDAKELRVGNQSTIKLEGFGDIPVRPDVLVPPGGLGLIMGEKEDALLRIENFAKKDGAWAYVMALDWNKDKSRMEKFSHALRAAMA
jgi:uncharacterized protein YndB with AHSA1/START domain